MVGEPVGRVRGLMSATGGSVKAADRLNIGADTFTCCNGDRGNGMTYHEGSAAALSDLNPNGAQSGAEIRASADCGAPWKFSLYIDADWN